MPEEILLKDKTKMSCEEVADFLVKLAEKVRSGSVTLKQNGNELMIQLPKIVELQTKVEREDKGGRVKKKLEVEIEYVEGEQPVGKVSIA